MSFDLEIAREGDLLVVSFVGRITPNGHEYETAIARFYDILARERPSRVLVDNRRLEGRADMGDTYFLVRKAPATPDFVERAAILEREEYRDYAEFHEVTSRNAGHRLICFFDEAKAREWLGAVA